MLIGYARQFRDNENLAPQLDALRAAGCAVICEEGADGKGLARALARCGSGDELVVWKLSRLGGSRAAFMGLVEDLRGRGAGLKVLTGAGAMIDTAGPDFPGVLAAIAEFERERRSEWTRRGMKAAEQRGRHTGRPLALTPQEVARARQWIEDGRLQKDVADLLGVSGFTLRRALRA
jgi:DNA invertase Pin-like site-specific DNA recombinase